MIDDIRYAIRTQLRNPLFTCGAVLTLALGIGVNSTIFTLANAMLFKPMPAVQSPAELVWISGVWRDTGRATGMSYPEYREYAARSGDAFSSVFAFGPASFSIAGGAEPRRVRGHVVSGSYFSGLGVTPSSVRSCSPAMTSRAPSRTWCSGIRCGGSTSAEIRAS